MTSTDTWIYGILIAVGLLPELTTLLLLLIAAVFGLVWWKLRDRDDDKR
jgi:hypothetical protein